MNRTELQRELKALRDDGTVLTCKLNAKTERLQLEYDRLTTPPSDAELPVCLHDINDYEPSVNPYEDMSYLPSRGWFPSSELLSCPLPTVEATEPEPVTLPVAVNSPEPCTVWSALGTALVLNGRTLHTVSLFVLKHCWGLFLLLCVLAYMLGHWVGTIWHHERTQTFMSLVGVVVTCLVVLAVAGWERVFELVQQRALVPVEAQVS